MSIFSSGEKYRERAEKAINRAIDISELQSNIDFQRGLLSNIRQHRLARSQLDLLNYSDSYTSSSTAGANAMLDTGLADVTRYSYETSKRSQRITDLKQEYEKNMKKYAEQQKTRSNSFKLAGAVIGAATGGIGALAMGATTATAVTAAGIGMQIGGGTGQIMSDTGQTSEGINNVIGGFGNYISFREQQDYNDRMLAMYENYMNRIYPTAGEQYTTGAIDIRPEQYRQVNILLGGE